MSKEKSIHGTLCAVALGALGLLSSPAHAAACTSSADLGSMGPPGFALLSNSFGGGAPSHFDDCYSFTLNNTADSWGLAWDWDLSFMRDIDLSTVALSGGSLAETQVRDAEGLFNFSDLLAGSYQLTVSGDITRTRWDLGMVGYQGALVAIRSSQVPEPATPVLIAIGLGLAAWTIRRGKRKA